jgi:hypothetical protein
MTVSSRSVSNLIPDGSRAIALPEHREAVVCAPRSLCTRLPTCPSVRVDLSSSIHHIFYDYNLLYGRHAFLPAQIRKYSPPKEVPSPNGTVAYITAKAFVPAANVRGPVLLEASPLIGIPFSLRERPSPASSPNADRRLKIFSLFSLALAHFSLHLHSRIVPPVYCLCRTCDNSAPDVRHIYDTCSMVRQALHHDLCAAYPPSPSPSHPPPETQTPCLKPNSSSKNRRRQTRTTRMRSN